MFRRSIHISYDLVCCAQTPLIWWEPTAETHTHTQRDGGKKETEKQIPKHTKKILQFQSCGEHRSLIAHQVEMAWKRYGVVAFVVSIIISTMVFCFLIVLGILLVCMHGSRNDHDNGVERKNRQREKYAVAAAKRFDDQSEPARCIVRLGIICHRILHIFRNNMRSVLMPMPLGKCERRHSSRIAAEAAED